MSIITKGLIGLEDLNTGTGTFSRSSSVGGSITLTKISLASLGASVFVVVTTTPVTATLNSVMLVNATGGNRTINLPTAVGNLGAQLIVKKTDSSVNTVTITPNGAEKIDEGTSFLLSLQNEVVTLKSDGVQWWVIG